MNKILRKGFLAICLLTTYIPVVAAPIQINGTLHEITTQTKNNRTLIKVRDLESLLNLQITYIPEERAVKLSDDIFNGGMVLWINNTKVSVLNEYEEILKQIDTTPQLINNATYLPIRVIADNFGYIVNFKDDTIILDTDTKRQDYFYQRQLQITKDDFTATINHAIEYMEKYDPQYYGDEILNVTIPNPGSYGIYAYDPIFKDYNEKCADVSQTFDEIILDLASGNLSAKDRLPLAKAKLQAVYDELDAF